MHDRYPTSTPRIKPPGSRYGRDGPRMRSILPTPGRSYDLIPSVQQMLSGMFPRWKTPIVSRVITRIHTVPSVFFRDK